MTYNTLSETVTATATHFGIPGVAVGVWADEQAHFAHHGVTSIDNPLPVDQDTLFLIGSVTKTFTATAIMRLHAEGKIDIRAPVRRYIPELQLMDQQAARDITVQHLLNHTAGLSWGLLVDTGEGDDALATYTARMAELEQIAAPGTRPSYSQAGYNLAGRVIEKVTGMTYERAVTSLLLGPLGLRSTFFARDDVMTRRFSVGHNRNENGTLAIARMWKGWRGDTPGGGIATSVADQLRWARFHLRDGRAPNGERVLPADILHQMREPTTALRGSSMGNAIGTGWFLRDVDGVRAIGHGGSSSGQFAELLVVPERGFAVVAVSNAGPDGIPCNQALVRWALQSFLGLHDRDPEPLPYTEAQAQDVVGIYENDVMTLTIDTTERGLRIEGMIKPDIRAALSAEQEIPPDHEPFDFGLLPDDEYIITTGAFNGQRGYFTRADGAITGVDLGGRLFSRRSVATQ